MKIKIDDEWHEIDEVHHYGHPMIEIGSLEFYVFEDTEAAGKAARKHWEDMAKNDHKEFACLLGEETLIQWGLGQYAGPGYTQVKSLNDWLDLWLDTPEEHFASYDGNECTVNEVDEEAEAEIGFKPTVAYRHN